jgi:predicted flap endonuclease-1-like 5' DNA nuclease
MTVITALIIGVIIGWLVEWVIDWVFWRRDDKKLAEQLAQAEAEVEHLKSQAAQDQATIEQLRTELNTLAGQISQPEDALERIKGIGAVFAQRLKAAGIRTFAQLAEARPEQIREIIKPEEWQKINPEGWIAEARALAAEKAGNVSKGA